MHFFKVIVSVTLVAATTILALPIGDNNHRSASSAPHDTTLSAKDQSVSGAHVPLGHQDISTPQPVNGYRTAVETPIAKDWHLQGDYISSDHSDSSATNHKRRHDYVNGLVNRELTVSFGAQVPEGEREAIRQQVIAHHNSLPNDHEQKGAVQAHVHKGWHVTTGEEHKGEHATFRYYKSGAKNQKNQIGTGVHVNKPAA